MVTIHATWSNEGKAEPGILIWGERLGEVTRARRGRPRKASSSQAHPFAADCDAIVEAWQSSGDSAPEQFAESWERRTADLWLPARAGTPVGSPESIAPSDDLQLAKWRVPCFFIRPSDALMLASSIPASASTSFADDIRFWRDTALFTLSLLARQRFVPGFSPLNQDEGLAYWRPVIDLPEDREFLQSLAERMPQSSACAAPARGDSEPTAPTAPFKRFIGMAVDEVVRRRAAATIRRCSAKPDLSPAGLWMEALLSGERIVKINEWQSRILARAVESWQDGISSDGGAALRTCFRLVAPNDDGEDPWRVEYLLQATDDLSLLVPASDVWKRSGSAISMLKERVGRPQERLLKDLGSASRLLPRIGDSLNGSKPTHCALSTPEAYSFLKETAPLLAESGFGVLVPEWWQGKHSGVRGKLKVASTSKSSPGSDGPSAFGMDSILQFDWRFSVAGEEISPDEFSRLVAMKQPLVRVRGQWVEFDPEQMQTALRRFESRVDGGGITARDLFRTMLGGEDVFGVDIDSVETDGWISDALARLQSRTEISRLPVPPSFVGELRPYQVRGYSWLAWMKEMGFGACLADDMGLGKTIQLIAVLLRLKSEGVTGPSLLICPTSVVGNWRREIAKFGPQLSVMVHHGPDRLSGEEFSEEAAKHDIVISSYALCYRDLETLKPVRWNVLALDEAQYVKNSGAKQSQAVRQLTSQFRVALTGTPVENRLAELWSIMDFLNPGYLGTKEHFRRAYSLPIERQNDADATSRLRSMVQPFVLRRLKTDSSIITDLPEKWEMKVYCPLTTEQATLYEAVVQDSLKQIEESDGIERKGVILATLMKLKQVCNHPSQFLKDGSKLDGRSGKLSRLTEMLREVVDAGESALVFTQFAEMGEMLQGYVRNTLGAKALFLCGGTPAKARDEMVSSFQDPHGPQVFVLSLKAGGVGLNLTRASHVFHFDRWWNPAVENQATDRAFRIGQMKNVQVHKFICEGTIEERVDEQMERKKQLAENVIGAGENWITELSTEQLRDMLMLRRDDVVEEADS